MIKEEERTDGKVEEERSVGFGCFQNSIDYNAFAPQQLLVKR